MLTFQLLKEGKLSRGFDLYTGIQRGKRKIRRARKSVKCKVEISANDEHVR